MRTLLVALILIAAPTAASAGKIKWGRWTPPAACEKAWQLSGGFDADARVVDASNAATELGACRPRVRWSHHRLVKLTYGGTNTSVLGVSVSRGRRRIVIRIRTQGYCAGNHTSANWVEWIRIPAGTTPVVAVEVTVPEAKTERPCLVP